MGEYVAVLGIDTTTVVATAAVVEDGRLLAEVVLGVQRNHAERILPAIDLVLRESGKALEQITRIAVSVGPGSFTGQRIGLSLAKGLAEGLGIQLVPISTLRVLAEQLSMFTGIVIPLLDAQRGQYYCAVFRASVGGLEQLVMDQALDFAALTDLLGSFSEPIRVTGEAASQVAATLNLELASPALRVPRASTLAHIAEHMDSVDPRLVVPNYIRPSSAQPKKGCE